MKSKNQTQKRVLRASAVSALACAVLLAAPSCSAPPLTEIIVTVDSSFPTQDIDMVRLVIVREGESRAVTADLQDHSLPLTQGIIHRGGSLNVSISAEAILRGNVVVEQLVPIRRFVEGETLRVSVTLTPSCIGVVCQDGGACVDGVCEESSLDAGIADSGARDAGQPDSGTDVGLLDARPLIDALADGTLDALPPGECPDDLVDVDDGEEFVCAERCPECRLRCKRADCNVTCRGGATCEVQTEGQHATVNCLPNSTCNLKTKKQGSVAARCQDATCDIECDGDGPCDIACPGSMCRVDCGNNDECTIEGCGRTEDCGDNNFACRTECR